MKKFTSCYKALLPVLLVLVSLGFRADTGKWSAVRRADWKFLLTRVVFWDNQRGFVKGLQRQLLITEDGGQNWRINAVTDSAVVRRIGGWADIQLTPEKDIWLIAEDGDGIVVRLPYNDKTWQFYVIPGRPILNAGYFIDNKHGWVAGYYGQIFRTRNGGQTWEQTYDFPEAILWDICFTDSLQGFTLVRTGSDQSKCYQTSDGGFTWNPVSNPEVRGRTMFFLDHKHGWILGEYNDVFLTTDGGVNWQTVRANSGDERQYSIYFLTPLKGWISGSNGLFLQTENGGRSWHSMSSPSFNNEIMDVFFVDEQHGWAVAKTGIIAATTDGGATWDWQIKASNNYLFSAAFIDENNGFVIGENIFMHTADGGKTWNQTDSLNGHEIQFVDRQHGWLTARHRIYATTDGGKSWQRQHTFNEHYLYHLSFIDTLHGWTISPTSSQTTLHRTQDGGHSWEKLPPLPYDLYDLDFVSSTQGWLAGGSGAILHTQDGGLTWELQRIGQPTVYDGLRAVDFVDLEYGWAVGASGQIWHTQNGGHTWERQRRTNSMDDLYTSVQFLDRNEGWVVGAVGNRLHTTDGGRTWDDSYSEYMGYVWYDVFFTDRDHGWVVGMYGAIDRFLGPGLSVSQPRQGVPEQMLLYPNHPNPVQNSTIIRYEVPIAAPVQLQIYDLLGRQVCTLVDAEKIAGRYEVNWDGRDETGRLVANGIYFYHLRAGKMTQTKKLIVAR